ncbi:enhancer of mRNA-decapping protein 4-like [Penaeus japonicus]|uniref:enhancer of mRNA-decapping protein 4-like n=1 Tax=Penaeus japonicus TaxID=27405 RepID=UPI001C70D4CA|nr:enhancer of mRNA-decapping protein 4-like [Penaeus japonicus]
MEGTGYKDGTAILQALLKTSQQGQTITFPGNEERFSSAMFSSEVKVEVGPTDHTSGSSSITTRNITNYPWDHQYLSGSLVALHCSGEYLAYAIKAPQKSSGMVRIINRKSGDRGLVKNIRGMVRDLAFAHLNQRVILAFTDHYGTLYVCEVSASSTEGTLNTDLLLEVNSTSDEASDNHRIIWCPYIPDEQGGEDDIDDPAYLLVLTHGNRAEIWNINIVLHEYGKGQIMRDRILTGYQLMEQHSAPITDAAFSPDGTALATAARDGYVKFFQVYMADEKKSPRCLHQWNPHDGKPLSALFFLDNHKNPTPEVQFWKYAVTGACNNSELRVWSCESWQCHQTLRFVPTPSLGPLKFKAAMDPSANFLLLSDINRRVMYVIVVCQDCNANSGGSVGNSGGIAGSGNCIGVKNGGGSGGSARLVSVSELPVQYPALSLAVTDAAWKPYKRWKHDHAHDHAHNIHDDGDDDGDGVDVVEGVVMRFVIINTKSLQEAILRFQPAIPLSASKATTSLDLSASQDSIVVRDGLTDLSMSLSTTVSEVEGGVSGDGGGTEGQPPPPPPPDALTSPQSSSLTSQHPALHTPPATQPPMNLLTPDSFSSPRKPEDMEHPDENSEDSSLSSKVTPISSKYDVPYNADFENAALSLLLRCGSGTLMPGSEGEGANNLNILGSVVSGSSKSPPATSLPPPPSGTPPPLDFQNDEEAPLATSEVSVTAAASRGGASATSSPSLEVQQILHSQNGKSSDYAEDEDEEDIRAADEVEMPDDDDDEDEDEEEDEPEALRQSHSHPKPPPLPEPQTVPQPPSSLAQPTPTSIAPPHSSMPQASSLPQPPSSMSHTSLPQPPPPASQPSSSMPQIPPVSIPQPPPSMPHPPQTVPKLPLKSPHLPETSPTLTHAHDTQKSMASAQPVDVFASVKTLPAQITCAQLEAEIKGGAISPEATESSSQQNSHQSQRNRNHVALVRATNRSVPDMRSSSSLEQTQLNGPVTPGVSAAEISELRSLVRSISLSREQSNEVLSQTLALANKLDKAIQQVNQLAKQVEEVRAAQSQVQMDLPHVVAASLRPVVEATLRSEMRNSVVPGVVKTMDPLRSHLSQEVHNLMKTSENQVIDAVTKVIHSRSFLDNLGGTVGAVVGPSVQNSCREAYNKLLLPGLNALTQQVFSQVNESFSRGTKEYLHNVESEMQSGRTAMQESLGKASQSLNTACSSLTTQTKNLQENVTKLGSQQNIITESLAERIRSLVREEVTRALQDHQAAVDARSRAHTPAPAPHPHNPKLAQQQVQNLISSGQFNTAFKQALSASDLSLVVFVCERVNPQQVFNITPCPLSQDVLLSLVNQLSHDLSTFTDLKIKYLEEAVMNLDASHPVTREHMRPVLQGFQRNLHTHLAANPNHKKVKMLLMAVNHLVAL